MRRGVGAASLASESAGGLRKWQPLFTSKERTAAQIEGLGFLWG